MINKLNLLEIIAITSKLKILYVEDNKESREQALKMLENYFSYIDVAVDGTLALQSYKDYFIETGNYYDLIITDIEMPKMDGIDLSKSIYKINKEQKILVVSAYSDKKYFINLINMGVEGFIQKPLSFEQVFDSLKEISKGFIDENIISFSSECSYNKLSKELFFNNVKIDISINEQRFLEYLMKYKNLHCSLSDIFNYIYYDNPEKEYSVDAVRGLVKRLRKKIPQEFIVSNRTLGYSLSYK